MSNNPEDTTKSTRWPQPNHNYVPEYQVSSIPYVTSSHTLNAAEVSHVSLPYVSRWLVIHNHGNGVLRLGFSLNGVNGTVNNNFYEIRSGEVTPRLEIKSKDLFLHAEASTSFSLIAGLTGVNAKYFPVLTGSLTDENGNELLKGIG